MLSSSRTNIPSPPLDPPAINPKVTRLPIWFAASHGRSATHSGRKVMSSDAFESVFKDFLFLHCSGLRSHILSYDASPIKSSFAFPISVATCEVPAT